MFVSKIHCAYNIASPIAKKNSLRMLGSMTKDEIKALRKRLGWTQAALAERLGVTQPQVSRIEDGGTVSGPIRLLLEVIQRENPA